MEESTPNMEGVSDTWEFDNNVKYLEQERYEGTVNLERHAADSWEPPENGSDFSGSLQNPSVEHDVYDGVSIGYNAGERDTDCRKRDRGGDPEADPDVLIHPSLSFGSYPAVSLDETLLVDQVDRLNNAPTYSDGIGAQDRRLDTCNREKWIKTGDQFQGTEPRKWSFENRSLSFRSDESGGVLGDSSSPTAVILKNLLVAMMQPQQSNKTISTSVYTIINTEVLDKKRKTWQNEEVVNVIKQIATSAESEPGSPMVFVFACLLFGLKCFHSILTNMLWIERKPLPKQTGLPYHCLSMTKGLMPCSRKESIVALYESVISPAPSVLPVYMMEFHGKDTDMLHVNQQRPNIQVSEAVNVVPLPSLPDRTDVAYVSDESESPDPAEETPQWKFQHVETSLSSDREYGCSDLSSFQTSRGNIHFTGNEKPSGNTVSLHSSTKMQKGKLIYGTSSDYISNFLSQRRTPARMRGVLRHPILQNMSTEEGFQRDVHYERWKDVAEDEFGRMMVCRGRDNHTVFTFFMIERNSNWFRDEELLFYLKCDGKVQIVPELLGVIEEDGYVKMMFPFTPGHEVLSTVVEAGRHLCNRKGLLRFLEQLVRGIEKLHANGVTLGVINDRMVLLDAELGSTGIHLFPWRSVRTTEHTNKKSTNQPLRGADPLTRAGKEDKATDMLSLGQLLQRILSRLQDPSPLATHLLVQLLEPDKEVRITASGASKHRLFEHRRCLSIECGEDAPII